MQSATYYNKEKGSAKDKNFNTSESEKIFACRTGYPALSNKFLAWVITKHVYRTCATISPALIQKLIFGAKDYHMKL